MELINIYHSPKEEIAAFNADLFIAASGYESRAIYIPQRINNASSKKVALCFKEHKHELSRTANDKFFTENNYQMIISDGKENPNFDQIFQDIQKMDLRVMLDISVMTRTWYHSLLKYLHELSGISSVLLKVVYCPAIYSGPVSVKSKIALKKFSLLGDERDSARKTKSTALILGLGNEMDVSKWVYNKINPEKTYLLYADPSIQKEYVENIFIHNHELIEKINIKDLLGYPMNSTKVMYSMLIDLVLPLRQEYQVVIVPQGPKIFALLSMIIQISYPDVELYFPQLKRAHLKDRKPYDDLTSIDLQFGTE